MTNRDASSYAEGYQAALVDIATAGHDSGWKGVTDWIANNATAETREQIKALLGTSDA